MQLGLSGQATGTLGLGAYLGAGVSGGANVANSPTQTGTSSSGYAEAMAGWGPSGGVSVTLPDDGSESPFENAHG